jgi:hypothetical protein
LKWSKVGQEKGTALHVSGGFAVLLCHKQPVRAAETQQDTRCAVMALKAFPLDYEGKVTQETQLAFARRQRALTRLYLRRLQPEPVPHKELAEAG